MDLIFKCFLKCLLCIVNAAKTGFALPQMQALQAMRGVSRGNFPAQAMPGFQPRNPMRPDSGFQSGEGGDQPALWHRSKYMEPDEIETILRIQWKSLHNGVPYQEDYYYQVQHFPENTL